MMKTRTMTLGLAASFLAFVPVASAQQYGQPQGQQMQHMQQMRQQMQQRMQQMRQEQQGQSSGQQGLDQEVRNFLQQAEQELTQAVQQGDTSRILRWTRQHVADDATFTTLMQVSNNGRTPSSVRADFSDKEDMLRKQAMMFSLVPELLKSVRDYNLDVQVRNVEQIDNNTALVRTRISESITLGGLGGRQGARTAQLEYGQAPFAQEQNSQNPNMQQPQGNQLGAALSGSNGSQGNISISGTADCKLLMYRSQDTGQLVLGMSTCRADASY